MNVLPKNRKLVFSIRNYIRDTREISLTSFLCLSFVFRLVFFFNFRNTHIYIIKRKLQVGLNIWSLSSRGKKISYVRCAHSWNLFFHSNTNMFAQPCNILYLYHCNTFILTLCAYNIQVHKLPVFRRRITNLTKFYLYYVVEFEVS